MGVQTLRSKIEKIIGTAVVKNDKNYTDDAMQAIADRDTELIARLQGMKRPGIQEYTGRDGETYHQCNVCGGYDECDCEGFNEAIEAAIQAIKERSEG